MVPGDRWILGQKVRYLIEAGRPQAADSMGIACAAQSDGPRDEELVSRARRLHGAAVRQLSARRRRLHVGARRDARVGTLEMGGSRAAPRRTRRRTVPARGRRAARLDDGRVLATRPAAVLDERERFAHGVSRAHHADVHRAGQPDRDERLVALGRSRDAAPLWRRALVHAGRGAPRFDGAAGNRRHSARTVVQLLPRRARVRVAGSTDARGLGVLERGEQADLRADLGRQLSAAHRSSGRALSARRLGVHRRGVRRQRRRGAWRDATGRRVRGRRRSRRRPSRHSARRSRRRASAWCPRWWRRGAR